MGFSSDTFPLCFLLELASLKNSTENELFKTLKIRDIGLKNFKTKYN